MVHRDRTFGGSPSAEPLPINQHNESLAERRECTIVLGSEHLAFIKLGLCHFITDTKISCSPFCPHLQAPDPRETSATGRGQQEPTETERPEVELTDPPHLELPRASHQFHASTSRRRCSWSGPRAKQATRPIFQHTRA